MWKKVGKSLAKRLDVMTVAQIEHRIEQVKQQLTRLRAMHPGSLSEQYNVCGKPGRRWRSRRGRVLQQLT
jgi:hypothetical protein